MATDRRLADAEQGRMSPDVANSPNDVRPLYIALGALGILVLSFAAAAFVAIPFFLFKEHRAEVSPPRSPEESKGWLLPPNPRLQASPRLDLQGYTAGYNKALSTYGWIDKANGIAAIPIDRALAIAAGRGIPRQSTGNPGALSEPGQGDRRTGLAGKVLPPPE